MITNNLEFLKTINVRIIKHNNKFYVYIPFISYNVNLSYIDNYLNGICILLNDEFLSNNDLEEYIKELDDRYDYVVLSNNYDNIISDKYSYFSHLNYIIDINIDEEDVKNTNSTFMKIITNSPIYESPEVSDYIYKYVIDYYANGQYDDAIILMNSVLNTQVTTNSQNSTCGCNQQVSNCVSALGSTNTLNTGTELVNYDNATCIDKYKAAIYQWLQNMLSDTEFYCHWLFIDTETGESIPNDTIIDKLIELLQFILDNYDLSTLGNSNSSYCNHSSSIKCDDSFIDNYGSSDNNICSNYSIIKNYIELLKLVKENKVIENKNKIYVYGKKFAEIFPLLTFN